MSRVSMGYVGQPEVSCCELVVDVESVRGLRPHRDSEVPEQSPSCLIDRLSSRRLWQRPATPLAANGPIAALYAACSRPAGVTDAEVAGQLRDTAAQRKEAQSRESAEKHYAEMHEKMSEAGTARRQNIAKLQAAEAEAEAEAMASAAAVKQAEADLQDKLDLLSVVICGATAVRPRSNVHPLQRLLNTAEQCPHDSGAAILRRVINTPSAASCQAADALVIAYRAAGEDQAAKSQAAAAFYDNAQILIACRIGGLRTALTGYDDADLVEVLPEEVESVQRKFAAYGDRPEVVAAFAALKQEAFITAVAGESLDALLVRAEHAMCTSI